MAVVSIVMGSVLGFVAALFCWFTLDFSFVEALSLYLIASLGCGALAVATSLYKSNTMECGSEA